MATPTVALFHSPLQSGYSQVYIKQTEVFSSTNRTETRRKLLDRALIGVSARFKITTEEQYFHFENIIRQAKINDDIIAMPLWFSRTTLASNADNTSNIITVSDASLEGFAASNFVVINGNNGGVDNDFRTISTVVSNDVTMTAVPSLDWRAGVEVVPCLSMKIDTIVKAKGVRALGYDYKIKAVEVE